MRGHNRHTTPLPERCQFDVFSFGHGLPREERDEERRPAGELQTGNSRRDDELDAGALGQPQRRLPVADRDVKRHRRGDDREIQNQKRQQRERHRHIVIADPLVFETLDPALGAAGFEAGRAKVPAQMFAIAQRAQKPPAAFARQHGFFLRVIEAARLALQHDDFTRAARLGGAEQGGKDFDQERGLAGGAGRERIAIESMVEQRGLALRAVNQRRAHGSFHDHAGVANAVVQRAFLLLVKQGHDVTDQADHAAEEFGKVRGRLLQQGISVPTADLMIAAVGAQGDSETIEKTFRELTG